MRRNRKPKPTNKKAYGGFQRRMDNVNVSCEVMGMISCPNGGCVTNINECGEKRVMEEGDYVTWEPEVHHGPWEPGIPSPSFRSHGDIHKHPPDKTFFIEGQWDDGQLIVQGPDGAPTKGGFPETDWKSIPLPNEQYGEGESEESSGNRKGGKLKPMRGRKMEHGGTHPPSPSRDGVFKIPARNLVRNIQKGDGPPTHVQVPGNLTDMIGPVHGPCPPGSERLADGNCKKLGS